MRQLLSITAILEAATGLALLAAPSLVASVLLGVGLESAAPRAVARVAGAALLALGVACWVAGHDSASRAARGVTAGMLLYNCGVAAVLIFSATERGGGLRGIGLWPAAILHCAMAFWCTGCLASRGTAGPDRQKAAARNVPRTLQD